MGSLRWLGVKKNKALTFNKGQVGLRSVPISFRDA